MPDESLTQPALKAIEPFRANRRLERLQLARRYAVPHRATAAAQLPRLHLLLAGSFDVDWPSFADAACVAARNLSSPFPCNLGRGYGYSTMRRTSASYAMFPTCGRPVGRVALPGGRAVLDVAKTARNCHEDGQCVP